MLNNKTDSSPKKPGLKRQATHKEIHSPSPDPSPSIRRTVTNVEWIKGSTRLSGPGNQHPLRSIPNNPKKVSISPAAFSTMFHGITGAEYSEKSSDIDEEDCSFLKSSIDQADKHKTWFDAQTMDVYRLPRTGINSPQQMITLGKYTAKGQQLLHQNIINMNLYQTEDNNILKNNKTTKNQNKKEKDIKKIIRKIRKFRNYKVELQNNGKKSHSKNLSSGNLNLLNNLYSPEEEIVRLNALERKRVINNGSKHRLIHRYIAPEHQLNGKIMGMCASASSTPKLMMKYINGRKHMHKTIASGANTSCTNTVNILTSPSQPKTTPSTPTKIRNGIKTVEIRHLSQKLKAIGGLPSHHNTIINNNNNNREERSKKSLLIPRVGPSFKVQLRPGVRTLPLIRFNKHSRNISKEME